MNFNKQGDLLGKPASFLVFASILIAAPFALSSAGVFSLLPYLVPFSQASAASPSSVHSVNSQNMQLLSAARTFDLNPSLGGGDISIVDGSALASVGGASESTIFSKEKDANDHSFDGQVSIYVVRQGDTLSEIASMFNVSVNTLRWANSIRSDTSLHDGQTLIILPITGVEHTVKKGDTISSIAKKYHADAKEILYYNDLSEGQSLKVGQLVIIPDGEVSVPQPTHTARSVSHKNVSPQTYQGSSNGLLLGYFIEPLKHYTKTQGIHGHNGVDLAAPVGTPIYAAASGDVLVSRNNSGWNGGYGNFVVIQHPNGEQTLYAHMSSDIVRVGQHVVQGQVVGYVGLTGHTTGPHVHVEVHGGRNPF